MRLSLQIKLTWKVLCIFFMLFSYIGLVLHYIFLVYLQTFVILYYGIVGIVFIFTLMVLQKGYLTYYGIKSKKDAKELLDSGKKPSDIVLQTKGIKQAQEIADLDPDSIEHVTQMAQQGGQSVSEKDLKRIEKQMRKKVKSGSF